MDYFSLAPLGPFLMIVGIVWVRARAKLEEKRIEAGLLDNGKADQRQENRIGELEERVRVLERIVTDGGYDLATRIEALRDARPAPVADTVRAPQPELR